jgi:hypothetical protein
MKYSKLVLPCKNGASERGSNENGGEDAWGFPLFAYDVSLRPPQAYTRQPKFLLLDKVVVDRIARRTGGKYREEMWTWEDNKYCGMGR